MAWLKGIKQAANAAVVRIVVNFVIYFDGLSIWLVLVLFGPYITPREIAYAMILDLGNIDSNNIDSFLKFPSP